MPGAPEPEDEAAVDAARPGSRDPSVAAVLAELLRLGPRSASSLLASGLYSRSRSCATVGGLEPSA